MNTDTRISPVSAPGLRRELGLASTTAAVIGGIIAVGIFLTPAGMAKALGSPLWLLVVWLAVGAMTLSGALCYGELAGRFPRAGGAYIYLQESYGPRTAFLYGWMCLLVMDPAVAASFATGIGGYFGYIRHLSPILIKLLGVGVIWALCLLNIFSIRVSAGFLRWVTWLKLGLLGFLTVWAVVFRLGSWSNFVPFVAQRHGSMPLAPALGVGLVGAFFSFAGWWDVGKIAGEVRDPGRNLPRALLFGVLAVTAVYIVVSAVFLYLVPLEKVTSDQTFVAVRPNRWHGFRCHRHHLPAGQFSGAHHVRTACLLRDGQRRPLSQGGRAHSSPVRYACQCHCDSGLHCFPVGVRRQF